MSEMEDVLSEYYGGPVRVITDEPKPKWALVGDGSIWPLPGEGFSDLEWRLRYGSPSREDHLAAASVVAAYAELIRAPRTRREFIVRTLREAAKSLPGARS